MAAGNMTVMVGAATGQAEGVASMHVQSTGCLRK